MLDRSHDLAIKLPDNIGDVPSSGVEPSQVDQDRSERHCQQHETGQHCSQPEFASGSSP
jgi:hypothetical protein